MKSHQLEYIKERQSLKEGFILFCLFDPLVEETKLEIEDFLSNLLKSFSPILRLYEVHSTTAEQKLIDALTPKDTNLKMPFFALAHPHIPEIELLQSNDNYFIYSSIKKYYNYYKNNFEKDKSETLSRIKDIVNSFPVVTFIKGCPLDPYCKFSIGFIDIIRKYKIDFRSFDIFTDSKIRGFMKFYHGFRTFPQLFINGELIGGLDIIKELDDKGELIKKIPITCTFEYKKKEFRDYLSSHNKDLYIIFYRKDEKNDDLNKIIEKLNKESKEYELYDLNKNLVFEDILKEDFRMKTLPYILDFSFGNR